jgi:phosphatidylserine/phosphatidylglycerophosphate/cardiolipin synthase-like enzyme
MLKDHIADVRKVGGWLEAKFKAPIPGLDAALNWLSTASNEMILGYTGDQLQSLSWNHGKVLAVNGKTMMTGGANFWDEAAAGSYDIIDQQAKIEGDAAISAHKWVDYFFR